MQRLELTYIHHNCFVMKQGGRAYLFDCPGKDHMPEQGPALIEEAVTGEDLTVLVSHGHEDHLHDNLGALTKSAAKVAYVLSDDIEEMRPEAVPVGEVCIVEPDETYAFNGLQIETLMSNDLGVAFLVTDKEFRFYFGGDLAKWIRKRASAREAEFVSDFFGRAMERVRAFKPHVAFSNVDRRLENLAGGLEAYQTCGASVFVPMHTFGDTEWLVNFQDKAVPGGPVIFTYRSPGDAARLEI